LVADLITVAGASRIITIDLHAEAIQGFFNIPVDHLYAMPIFIEYIRSLEIDQMVLVSPDAGGTARARANSTPTCATAASAHGPARLSPPALPG
jgi:ribose-phosphate pyrophosphokinase